MKTEVLIDIARDLFRAVSYVLRVHDIHREDQKYILLQLCKHYVYYYLYFEYLDKDLISDANTYCVKANTAKQNVVTFYENRNEDHCARVLNEIFGKDNWEHSIVDGSIPY